MPMRKLIFLTVILTLMLSGLVSATLVQGITNGGFEGGSFYGWTLYENTGRIFTQSSSPTPHSGSYEANFNPNPGNATIYQNFYVGNDTLDFYYRAKTGTSPTFTVWGSGLSYSDAAPPTSSWAHGTLDVSSKRGTNITLYFTFGGATNCGYLDDVSILNTPPTPPVTITISPTTVAPGSSIQLNDTSGWTSPTLYNISWGDSSWTNGTQSGYNENATHSFTNPGTYNVVFYLSNASYSLVNSAGTSVFVYNNTLYLNQYIQYQKLGLHFNTSGFPDDFGHTIGSASATLNTAVYKYGGGSVSTTAGHYVYVNSGAQDCAWGTENFTIVGYVNATSYAGTNILWDQRPVSGGGAYPTIWVGSTGILYYTEGGSIQITGTHALPTGSQSQVIVQRVNGNLSQYVNGVYDGSWADSTNYLATTGTPFIGGDSNSPGLYGFTGSMDEWNAWNYAIPISELTSQNTETNTPMSSSISASFLTNLSSPVIAPVTVQFNDTSTGSPTSWNYSYRNATPGNNTQIWWTTSQNPVLTFGLGNFAIILNASTSTAYGISGITWINTTTGLNGIGDSLTRATGGDSLPSDGSGCYINQMAATHMPTAYVTHNSNGGGWTTADGLANITSLFHPGFNFIWLGFNDASAGIDANTSASNLEATCDYVTAHGGICIIMGKPMAVDLGDGGWTNATNQHNNITVVKNRLAADGYWYIPVWDYVDSTPNDGIAELANTSFMYDNQHQNLAGHTAIAEGVWNWLQTRYYGPIAVSSLSRNTLPVGEYTWYNDTSLNSPTSYLWTFGDGSNSTTRNGSHTYYRRGIFNVSSNVSNSYSYNVSYNIERVI